MHRVDFELSMERGQWTAVDAANPEAMVVGELFVRPGPAGTCIFVPHDQARQVINTALQQRGMNPTPQSAGGEGRARNEEHIEELRSRRMEEARGERVPTDGQTPVVDQPTAEEEEVEESAAPAKRPRRGTKAKAATTTTE